MITLSLRTAHSALLAFLLPLLLTLDMSGCLFLTPLGLPFVTRRLLSLLPARVLCLTLLLPLLLTLSVSFLTLRLLTLSLTLLCPLLSARFLRLTLLLTLSLSGRIVLLTLLLPLLALRVAFLPLRLLPLDVLLLPLDVLLLPLRVPFAAASPVTSVLSRSLLLRRSCLMLSASSASALALRKYARNDKQADAN